MKSDNVKHYFDSVPSATECFTTSDGTVFTGKNHAESYALELKDKSVKNHQREEYATEEKELVPNTPAAGDEGEGSSLANPKEESLNPYEEKAPVNEQPAEVEAAAAEAAPTEEAAPVNEAAPQAAPKKGTKAKN